MNYRKIDRRLILDATEKWKHLWGECATNHVGTSIMYSRILTKNLQQPSPQAAVRLRILENTNQGIRFVPGNGKHLSFCSFSRLNVAAPTLKVTMLADGRG